MALSVSIELVTSSARVNSAKFYKYPSVSQFQTLGPIDRTPGIPGSDKNMKINSECEMEKEENLPWRETTRNSYMCQSHSKDSREESWQDIIEKLKVEEY